MKRMYTLFCIIIILALTPNGWAASINIVNGTEGPVTLGDFTVSGFPNDGTPPGQTFQVFGSNADPASEDMVLGLIWDELDGIGVSSATTLIFGFSANQTAADSITIDSLDMTFGGQGTFSLGGSDFVTVKNFVPGNSRAEAIFAVDLGFDFMSTFSTITATNLTTAMDFTNQNDGFERMYLMSGMTQTANVPIPAAIYLLGAGFVGIAGLRRKIKK